MIAGRVNVHRVFSLCVAILIAGALLAFIRQDAAIADVSTADAHLYLFNEIKWFALAAVVAVWGLGLFFGLVPVRKQISFSIVDFLILAFLIWAAVSLVWTPDIKAAVLSVAHGGIAAGAYVLARLTEQKAIDDILQTLGLTCLTVALALTLSPDPHIQSGFGNENFAAEFLAVSVGIGAVYWWRGGRLSRLFTRVVVGLGLVYLLAVSPAHLQFLGLAAGVLYVTVVVVERAWFRWGLSLAIIIAVVLAIGATVLDPDIISDLGRNNRDRLQTWANTVLLAREAPLFGHGLGSFFHGIGGFTDRFAESFRFLGEPAYVNFARQTDSAENEILQVLAELGAVGLAIMMLGVSVLYYGALKRLYDAPSIRMGLPLTIILALSLVSFPLENPATLILAALIVGRIRAEDSSDKQVEKERRDPGVAARWVRRGVATTVASQIAILVTIYAEIPAGLVFARGDLLDRIEQPSLSAMSVLDGINYSDRSPRLRLRAYTQTIVAGPEFWSGRFDDKGLDELYALAASASPGNAVLLDLRLKNLLTSKGRQLERAEIETMLEMLRRNSGRTSANAFVLEAAYSLQLGDKARARSALIRARQLIGQSSNANDKTNLRNITSLEAQLDQ